MLPQLYAAESPDSLVEAISSYDLEEQVKILTETCWDYRSKNPQLAIEYGQVALRLMDDLSDPWYYSEVYNYLGVIYGNLGMLDSAYSYYIKAFEIAETINDSTQIAYSLNNIGDYYYKSALFSIALENIYMAYEIFEKIDNQRGMAYTLNDIGEIYLKQKDYDKALDHFLRSGNIRFELGDDRGYAKSLLNQANAYAKMGDDDKALSMYKEAMIYSKKAGYIKGESWVLAGLSSIYTKQKRYEEALENRFDALEIDLEIGNKYGEIINYNQIGYIYFVKKNYAAAKTYLLKALQEGESTGHRDQSMISYNLLRRLSILSGNYKNAYSYLEKYEALEDSIFSQESANKIADLQTAFLTERKDRENMLLKKTIEYEKQTRNYLVMIFVLILGAVVLLIWKFRAQKKANKQLNMANKELNDLNAQKDKMFSIIGHDLKNPVGSIMNFLEILHTDYDVIDEEKRQLFIQYSYESSKQLTDLLMELLEWGRISRGLIKINPEEIELGDICEGLQDLLYPNAQQKEITIELGGCDVVIRTDRNMINTVLRNFLNNAIKFTPRGGTIKLFYEQDKEYHYITTEDTGIGIPEEQVDDLFRIDKVTTTAGTEKEEGTGLGLPIAKEFVDKCNGDIIVESEPGKGSKFILKLPK